MPPILRPRPRRSRPCGPAEGQLWLPGRRPTIDLTPSSSRGMTAQASVHSSWWGSRRRPRRRRPRDRDGGRRAVRRHGWGPNPPGVRVTHRPTRAGRMMGRGYVRAMGEFLTNDSAGSSRGRLGHQRGGRSVLATYPRRLELSAQRPSDRLPARSVARLAAKSSHSTVRSMPPLSSRAGVGSERRAVDQATLSLVGC